MPPLYHVKLGNQELYFEKDSQLEELLVRERVKDIAITSRDGEEVSLTEARYQRFVRALSELEAWQAKLESEYPTAAHFVIAHRLVETGALTAAEAETAIAAIPANGYELSVTERLEDRLSVKVVETETSAATHLELPGRAVRLAVLRQPRSAPTRSSPRSSACPTSSSPTARRPPPPRATASCGRPRSSSRRKACRSAASRGSAR